MYTISYIRNTLDTTDEFYEKEVEYNDEHFAALGVETTMLSKAILECKFTDEINNEYGPEYLVIEKREVDKFKDELVPYIQQEANLSVPFEEGMSSKAGLSLFPFNSFL
ncbi:MAG: M3 family oligoendopeptidase [Clostridiales bacterium]|jgi:hypothetical protein|nr:M3 family oligoendopeptidase [Clostridiales bacterium]